MTNHDAKPDLSAFFDRLIAQVSPHPAAPDQYLYQAKIMCGRWLTLHRLALRMSVEQLARATHLPADAIFAVETGLANAALGTPAAWRAYCRALADAGRSASVIHAILMIALGQDEPPTERVLMRVLGDLKRLNARSAPDFARGREGLAAISPWGLLLRWIDKSIAPVRAAAVGSLKLTLSDLGRATVLMLPEIETRAIYTAALQPSAAAPVPAQWRNQAAMIDDIIQALAHDQDQPFQPVSEAPRRATASPARPAIDERVFPYLHALRQSISHMADPILPAPWNEPAERHMMGKWYVALSADGAPRLVRQFESTPEAPLQHRAARPARAGRHQAGEREWRYDAVTLALTRAELLEEAVANASRLVVLGEAGSGKSMALRYLAQQLAESCLDTEAALPRGWRSPVVPFLCSLVVLAEQLSTHRPRGADALVACLLRAQLLGAQEDTSHIRQLLLQGNALVLLDGLDELASGAGGQDSTPRGLAVAAIHSLARHLPAATRMVVTCQTQWYYAFARRSQRAAERLDASAGWQVRTIRALSGEQVRTIIRRRTSPQTLAARPSVLYHDADGSSSLAEQISGNRQLASLYASPLSLALLMTLLGDDAADSLPLNRAQLYERFVALVLRRSSTFRQVEVGGRPLADTDVARGQRAALQAAAFAMVDAAGQSAQRNAALQHDLRRLFPHAAIQEFLAACHLASLPDAARRALDLWHRNDIERSRTMLVLMAGRLQQIGLARDELLPWLLLLVGQSMPGGGAKSTRQRQRDALLAADSYAEVGQREGFRSIKTLEIYWLERALADALLSLLLAEPLAPTAERLSAGRYLQALGDPRQGVATLMLEWCAVEPGGPGDDLQISRYPITNAQWRFFVDDQGYTNPQWWGGEAARAAAQPRFWEVPGFDAANQPVVGISWFEAEAFCSWLTARGRAEGWLAHSEMVRPPTADEWDRAARGADDRRYPWGDSWDVDCANTSESALQGPAPVGCYPHSASACGALDMGGNVAEWCSDDGKQPRFIRRGGSWAEDHEQARCAAYRAIEPETRGNLLGLRVVREKQGEGT